MKWEDIVISQALSTLFLVIQGGGARKWAKALLKVRNLLAVMPLEEWVEEDKK